MRRKVFVFYAQIREFFVRSWVRRVLTMVSGAGGSHPTSVWYSGRPLFSDLTLGEFWSLLTVVVFRFGWTDVKVHLFDLFS